MKRNKFLSSFLEHSSSYFSSISIFLCFFISVIAITGCSTMNKISPMMDQLKIEEITAQELQIRVREFSHHFARIVEEASERIMEMSNDPSVRKHALAWKIYAIPECHSTSMEHDPLMAFIDTWTFTAQIADYFETGNGKDVFGKFQSIAIDTSRNLETQIMNDLKDWAVPEGFEKAKCFVKDWKLEHPLTTHFFNRDSTLLVLSEVFKEDRKGTFATVGSLDQNTRDIADRITFLTENLPRTARWHAEYLMETTVSKQNIDKILDSMTTLVESIDRMTHIVEQSPELINNERIGAFAEIQKERELVLESINKQRTETITVLQNELVAIIESLRKERIATVSSLQRERIETLKEILNMTDITVEDVSGRIEKLVVSMFWKVCLLLAGLIIFGLVIFIIIYWIRTRKLPSSASK